MAPPDQPNREKEIFEAALDRSPGAERQSYLEAECGADRTLLERVQELLQAHEVGEDFLPEEPKETIGIVKEKPGDQIGRYTLLQQIGEGGCGVVYMAEQSQPVRRKVALKIIKLGMDTRRVIARFEAERQALALMDHPNIAKVLDAGATETGRPYFVMELVGGIKITGYCDQNNLTMRERLDLFIQVCRAIQHAHQKGIIHRDIKPSNVLVTTHDGVPVPKVIDFGIAKATEGRLGDQTVFTAFEQFVGTPTYMSPEQAQVGGLDVDTRSDIYSLGVLLYELLTGKTPFDTHTMLTSGLDGIRRTIQEKEPSRPSTRLKTMAVADLKTTADRRQVEGPKLIHLVRGDPDWIVMKCLEKDRTRRYATANGLAHDIERYLKNEPIVARPRSRFYEFQKSLRRHKFGFAAAAGVTGALCSGIVATTWEAIRARRLGNEAQVARRDATDKLWQSYVSEARASRQSSQAGRHFASLEALRKAAAIRPSLTLSKEALLAARNEAIASMVLPDIRWLGRKDFSKTRESIGYDPTLKRYSLCDKKGIVSVRRMADDREERRLPQLGVAASAAGGFSPDGKFLAVPYADHHWRVWDWSRPVAVLQSDSISWYDFGPDNQTFAISDTTNIVFHDLVSGKQVGIISLNGLGSPASPGHFLFDPTGERMALFHTEAHTNVTIVDIRTGHTLNSLQHPADVWSVTWHPDGKQLATGCGDGTIRIWDSGSGQPLRMWRADCVSLAFNHRGDVLASSGWVGYTRLWEFGSGRELASIYKSVGIRGFSPNDQELVGVAWDFPTLEFFEVAPEQGLQKLYEDSEPHGTPGCWPLIDQSGRMLAIRTQEGIEIFDLTNRRQIASARLELNQGLVGFDEDGENLIMTGPKGLFRCPITKPRVQGLPAIGEPVLVSSACPHPCMTFISANKRICSIEHDYGRENIRCKFFRMDTFEQLAETGIQPGMRYCNLSPDGSLFASGAWHRGGVNVWDTQTGALIKQLQFEMRHEEAATSTVVFSPSGKHLVTATMDEYLFWEVSSWSLVRRIPQVPDNDWVPMMTFSRDGRIFAGTHSRSKIRLHDAATGQVLADLESPGAKEIIGLCFNHNGSQLAACESWNALRLWDLRVIRQQLAELGLDWDQPPYPPADRGRPLTESR